MAKDKEDKEPEVAPKDVELTQKPNLIEGKMRKKHVKTIAWMLECSHPRSSFVSRQRLGLEYQGLFCVACRTQLVFKGGTVFGSDGKTDLNHKLMAIKE